MKRTAIAITLILSVIAISSVRSFARNEEILGIDKVRPMEQRLRALNVINGLFLSESQLVDILDILYELRVVNNTYRYEISGPIKKLKKAYAALEADLMDDELLADESINNADSASKKMQRVVRKYREEVAGLDEQLAEVFNDKQLYILDEAKICVIPHQYNNAPSIGQPEGASRHLVNLLEQMRKMDRMQFESRLAQNIDRWIENIELSKGKYEEAELRSEIRRIEELADSIYQMNEVEFEIRKEDLAMELRPELPASVQKMQQQKLGQASAGQKDNPQRTNDIGKAGRLLLNEDLIDIFEKKLEQVRAR